MLPIQLLPDGLASKAGRHDAALSGGVTRRSGFGCEPVIAKVIKKPIARPQAANPASGSRRPDTGCRRSARAPGRRRAAMSRSASVTSGPGTGDAAGGGDDGLHRQRACCSGSRHGPDGGGQRQQRAQELRRILGLFHADDQVDRAVAPSLCRCSARATPAPGLWPPSSQSSQSGGSSSRRAGRAGVAAARAIRRARGRGDRRVGQAGGAQGGDGDAGVVELERAGQRRQRQRRRCPPASVKRSPAWRRLDVPVAAAQSDRRAHARSASVEQDRDGPRPAARRWRRERPAS